MDQFLKASEKPSWDKTYTLVNIGNKKKQEVHNEEANFGSDVRFDIWDEQVSA